MDDLMKSCPFHSYTSMVGAVENDYGRWQVGCGACGSFTGTHKTKEEAIAAWNTRHEPYSAERIVTLEADYADLLQNRNHLSAKIAKIRDLLDNVKER